MVFVIDTNKKPCDPIHEGQARWLLDHQKAAVFRHRPFTIILKSESQKQSKQYRLKIDPGSRTTGLAIVDGSKVVFGANLQHRGQAIKSALDDRRSLRRGRRNRKTRYRKPRFLNRTRPKGWLPPSLESRIANTETWVRRLSKLCPISAISMELVKFDTQLLENPDISGVEYQQGTLYGYEVKEYLLEKFGRKCAYCGKTGVPLEVEHIIPKSRGGSDRISNLTLACTPCNQKKNNRTAEEFGHPEVMKQVKQPLKDAAAVNAIRWKLYERLKEFNQAIECSTGGRTKWNRKQNGLDKDHWIDAACVGDVETVDIDGVKPLQIKATGYGTRKMCQTDKYGFPIRHRTRSKTFMGFATGDLVKAIKPNGKGAGILMGRVTIRQRPSFTVSGINLHSKYCTRLQANDGYDYPFTTSPNMV
jgi:5-methylcytosine-specific restriction endonuclease McrA